MCKGKSKNEIDRETNTQREKLNHIDVTKLFGRIP